MSNSNTPVYRTLDNLAAYGYKCPVTKKDLCAILQVSDRQLRRMVELERKSGKVIISCSHMSGYFIPERESEVEVYIADTMSRIKALEKTVAGAKKYLAKMKSRKEQPELF